VWLNKPQGLKPLFLPRAGVIKAIRQAQGKLNLCEGKPDFLSLLAAGIPNAAGFFATYWIPADLGNQLESWGVRYLRVFAHPDTAGAITAQKIADLVVGKIEAHFLKLPPVDGKKRDLNDLWQSVKFDRHAYRELLAGLPEVEIKPRPVKVWEARPVSPCTLPQDKIRAYGLGVLRRVTNELQNVSASRNNSLFAAAAKLGNYVAAGALDRSMVENDLMAIGCAIGLGQAETIRTVQSGLRAGEMEPADLSKLADENKEVRKAIKSRPNKAPQGGHSASETKEAAVAPQSASIDVMDCLNSPAQPKEEAYIESFYAHPRLSAKERMAAQL
jgi:hypothetical protein